MSTPVLPYVIITGLLLCGLAQKLYGLRRRRDDPVRWAVCFCLASLTMATAVQWFTGAIDERTGVPHLADALSDVGAMCAAGAGRVFLTHVYYPASSARVRARRSYVGLAAAVVMVAVLFVAVPPEPDTGRSGTHVDAVYLYVYIWYISIALLSVSRMGLRYSRLADRSSLRLGLRVLVAGSACGFAFLAVKAVMLVGEETGRPLGWLDRSVDLPLELGTEALLLAGVTIPAWGDRLGTLVRWAGDCRSYRRLHPLWLALHETNPDLSLMPHHRTGRRFWRRDVGFLLYRQVIEIRDGQLALRPYVHPAAVEVARALGRRAGLSEEEVRAAVEAATIAAGIAAKAGGRGTTGTPSPPPAPPLGPDLDAEITWLTKVSRAFAGSPVVPATVASLAASERAARHEGNEPMPHPHGGPREERPR
ncbi:MAB_1171c family putative transporter [Actinoallomurus sp. CA-142502]|uniref:MAB_1171c family putative transporter n=1 Tax=Actinoallomurus sp. CA-142502 TaxID=3239885 RepID=UPI003D9490C2